jgi:hypothetical protein
MISDALRGDLATTMPLERVFQKHVVDGKSYFFQSILKDADLEYSLRHDVANGLGISINDVVIMGSAKLGFSVKTENFAPFDALFWKTREKKDRSDIDVAIVNRELFDKINREIYNLSRHFDSRWIKDNWKINRFYSNAANLQSPLYKSYVWYLAKGWARQDFMPLLYSQSAPWVSICDAWRKRLDRKVSVGFYSDWHYLKNYQMDNLQRLRSKISMLTSVGQGTPAGAGANVVLLDPLLHAFVSKSFE